jgi:hypothetical protein
MITAPSVIHLTVLDKSVKPMIGDDPPFPAHAHGPQFLSLVWTHRASSPDMAQNTHFHVEAVSHMGIFTNHCMMIDLKYG